MKVKHIMIAAVVSVAWALALTVPVTAQQSSQRGSGEMAMGDIMQQCQGHYQQATATLDRLTAKMAEAEQSNDPAQMHTVLGEARQPLAAIKDHMGLCMQTMHMMLNMPGGVEGMASGGSGGQMQGMMSGQQGQQGSGGAPAPGSSATARTSEIGSCCPLPRKIPAALGITGAVLVAAFVVSLIAALVALTVFLLRRSRGAPGAVPT